VNVDCYMEDGPLRDEVHQRQDAPATLIWKTAKKPMMSFVSDHEDPPPDYYDVEVLEYHRELAPHRSGCVCYWMDRDARQRAYYDDTVNVEDVPTGMLSACLSAP
jgi:hypothetical protein